MTTKQEEVGCVAVFILLWSLCVTAPMWLVLLFALLSSVEAPPHAWPLYWAYVPAHLIGIGLGFLFRLIADGK